MSQRYFFKNEELELEEVNELIDRKIAAHAPELMIVEVHFKKGGIGAVHEHVHEQVSYCISGKLEFMVNGETSIIGPGDSIYMPKDLPHGAVALEDTVLLDIFTPRRDDFLTK